MPTSTMSAQQEGGVPYQVLDLYVKEARNRSVNTPSFCRPVSVHT